MKRIFELGQSVFLKSDQETQGVVTGLIIRPHCTAFHYFVTWGQAESVHYDFELTAERSFSLEESKSSEG